MAVIRDVMPAFELFQPASIDDVSDAVVAARVVVAFVEQHRRTLRAGRRCESRHEVRGVAGETAQVRVTFTAELPLPWLEAAADAAASADPIISAIESIVSLTRAATETGAAVRRLAWSFFRGPGPDYVGDDPEETGFALARCMEWAIFGPAADASGRTLAVRVVEEARQRVGDQRYHEMRAVAAPAYSVYRVERVEPDTAFHLLDLASGERLRLHSRPGHSALKKNELLFGALFPAGDGGFIGGAAITSFRLRPGERFDLPEGGSGFAALAPWLEAEFFGADTLWMNELDDEDLAAAYADFARDLRRTGTRLPSFRQLRTRVTRADLPTPLLQEILAKITWWTLDEANLFAAFFMRIWNRTPRAELGGLTPEQKHHLEKQRERKSKPRSRRRK